MQVFKAGLFAKKGIDTPYFSFHRNYKGFDVDRSIDYSISEDHPLIKLLACQYRCYDLPEIEERLGSLGGLGGLVSLEPALVVPLKAKGVINGLIVIGKRINEEPFSDYEKEYVLNIAILAAIAINNAFLFEMTTTDMMTRLKMKHYFYTILLEKMEQAALAGRPLSLIMMDIDFFKKFNDTHGHLCGDAVLKQVARVIQESIRTVDLAARYGGEEFCVLLPDTDLAHAKSVAERIRLGVSGAVTDYEGSALRVTISLGIARYDASRDVSGKAFIDRADRALYASKQGGRDRTTCAD
jgi:diguanylate cyclase (GGDEF)-like protein